MAYEKYFKDINAKKKIEKLIKKYKNKKIVLYGIGEFYDEIVENYDISKLNIVGVSDLRFAKDKTTNQTNYPAFAPQELNNVDFDIILITAFEELTIVEYLKNEVLEKKKKITAFLKPSFLELFKILFFSSKELYIKY